MFDSRKYQSKDLFRMASLIKRAVSSHSFITDKRRSRFCQCCSISATPTSTLKSNTVGLAPCLETFKVEDTLLYIWDAPRGRRTRRLARHPLPPVPGAFRLIALAACRHKVGDLADVPSRPFIRYQGPEVIPFIGHVAAISTTQAFVIQVKNF